MTCPELLEGVKLAVQNKYHAHDVWAHNLLCLDACAGDPVRTDRRAPFTTSANLGRRKRSTTRKQDYTFYDHDPRRREDGQGRSASVFASRTTSRARILAPRSLLTCFITGTGRAAVCGSGPASGASVVDDLLTRSARRDDARGKGVTSGAPDLAEASPSSCARTSSA